MPALRAPETKRTTRRRGRTEEVLEGLVEGAARDGDGEGGDTVGDPLAPATTEERVDVSVVDGGTVR